jgi:PAS domain S-box-containing protein
MDTTQANPKAHEKTPNRPLLTGPGWVLRYGLAVGAVAGAMGLRQALTAWVGPGLPPYITFYPMVMVVALLGGFGPGLLATALTGLVVSFWLLPPAGHFTIASPLDRLGLVIFIGMGVFMSVVADLYRRHRHKAAAYDREAALRESQARLATFATATFEGIVESEAGRIVDCNEQFERMVGYTLAELRELEIASLAAPEDRDRVMANMRQGRQSVAEHAMVRKDGARIIVEAHGLPVSPGSGTRLTAIRDITKRKQAEEALQHNVRLLNDIIDGCSPSAIFLKDRAGKFITINAPLERMLGMSRDELKGKTDYDLFPKEVADLYRAHDTKVMATAEAIQVEEAAQLPDGHHIFLANKFPLVDAEGHVYGVGAISHDITARKQAEKALRENRERLDLALTSARMATFDWDIVKNKRTWSEGVHALLGTKSETFTGTVEEFFQIIHPEDRSTVQSALARAVEASGDYETEYRAVWPDGSVHHIAARGKVHHDNAGRAVQMTGVCWDITAHKQAEAELRRRAVELRAANEELTRFNRVTVGRELRIIELKKQVNDLYARLSQPPRYATEPDEAASPRND